MARRGKTYALFSDLETQPTQQPKLSEAIESEQELIYTEVSVCEKQLWLALQFYDLPLEVLCQGEVFSQAVVVVAEKQGKAIIVACNQEANDEGIQVGLSLAAAYAMVADIKVLAQNQNQEQAVLMRLAAWAKKFTSLVSLNFPQALLLEIKGSLGLFGGLDGLTEQVSTDLYRLGFQHHLAIAPTPTAALWLSRYDTGGVACDAVALNQLLGRLPINATDWPTSILTRLQGIGVQQLRDCMRLPRDGFARRVGKKYLLELDRALGKMADPRENYWPPDKFIAKREFMFALENAQRIFLGLDQLLKELVAFLRGRQCGIQSLMIKLYHQNASASQIRLGMVNICRDHQRMAVLLRQKLELLKLPEAVCAVTMMSGPLYALSGSDGELFGDHGAQQKHWPELVEKLRARLGVRAVSGMCLVPEHRPEQAWKYAEPGTSSDIQPYLCRPLWMFSEPYRMPMCGARPQWQGELKILHGPERIETGWWDSHDAARDYYVVLNQQGACLWVYRQRKAQVKPDHVLMENAINEQQENYTNSNQKPNQEQAQAWYVHGIFA